MSNRPPSSDLEPTLKREAPLWCPEQVRAEARSERALAQAARERLRAAREALCRELRPAASLSARSGDR